MSFLAVGVSAGVAVAGTVASSAIQAGAAKKAGKQQAKSADAALELQREQYEQQRADLAPWRSAGGRALGQLERLAQQGPPRMNPWRAPAGARSQPVRLQAASRALRLPPPRIWSAIPPTSSASRKANGRSSAGRRHAGGSSVGALPEGWSAMPRTMPVPNMARCTDASSKNMASATRRRRSRISCAMDGLSPRTNSPMSGRCSSTRRATTSGNKRGKTAWPRGRHSPA